MSTTPKRRAELIASGMGTVIGEAMNLDGKAVGEFLTALQIKIAWQIDEAVATERERCAQFVETEAMRYLRGPGGQDANTQAQNHAIGTRLLETATTMRGGE